MAAPLLFPHVPEWSELGAALFFGSRAVQLLFHPERSPKARSLSVQVTVRTTAMVLMISIVWPASLLIRGCSPQTMRPDCMRTRRGWPDMVNMSIGSVCPNSLVVYRDLQAQQKVPQNMLMDRLLDQIVGGIEKENKLLEKENMLHTENQVLLEKQLRQIATGTPAA